MAFARKVTRVMTLGRRAGIVVAKALIVAALLMWLFNIPVQPAY